MHFFFSFDHVTFTQLKNLLQCTKFHKNPMIFIARQLMTRDIDIASMSVSLSVRPSVCLSDRNDLTYFFTIR